MRIFCIEDGNLKGWGRERVSSPGQLTLITKVGVGRYFFIIIALLWLPLLSFNYDPTKASFVCGMNCQSQARTGNN
jgi:hypothetical protein